MSESAFFRELAAGAGAGAASAIFLSPLEVARTRLQIQRSSSAHYHGTFNTMKTIFVEEGTRGLFRGLSPNLLALVPNWMVYFAVYNEVKTTLTGEIGYREGPSVHVASAVSANALTSLVVTPFWTVKTRLQTQHARSHLGLPLTTQYTGTLDCFSSIVRKESWRVLWSGLGPQMFASVQVGIQFPLYEHLKATMQSRAGDRDLAAGELIFASATAKLVSTMAAYPTEVVRSRLQSQHSSDPRRYKNAMDAVRTIAREEGVRGFYRALSTTLIRAVPSAVVTFTTYEMIRRHLQSV